MNEFTGVTRRLSFWNTPTQYAARCPDGRVRRTCWLAQSPDTYFSHPAAMRIRGTYVTGYITQVEGEYIFVIPGSDAAGPESEQADIDARRCRTCYLRYDQHDGTEAHRFKE